MNLPDWKWTPVQSRLPANAQTVAIKFWDGSEAVRYGIGWYNAKEQSWVVTAEPGRLAPSGVLQRELFRAQVEGTQSTSRCGRNLAFDLTFSTARNPIPCATSRVINMSIVVVTTPL